MMEYSIIVVDLCTSVFQLSSLGRFKTALKTVLTDPQLLKVKADLTKWEKEISQEVMLLLHRRLKDERSGCESSKSLVQAVSDAERRRRRANARAKWLDACTDYDYERQHSLFRRRGDATFFRKNPAYQSYRNAVSSSNLLCSGILGSGKSVLMANMVDDLVLENTDSSYIVAFFFVADDAMGLRARTILGSLVRQILESLPNTEWTDALVGESHSLTPGTLTSILCKALPPQTRIYFVLDGLDDFDPDERRILVEQLKELQSWVRMSICISFRLQAKSRAQEDFACFRPCSTLEIPRTNPDIERYIKNEIESLVDSGELLIRDSATLEEIRQRLVDGADGM